MEEINNFQQEPDESLFRACERFKELLIKCPQHYLTDMQEVILFYNGLDVPTRQTMDSKCAIPSKTAADAKVAIQEMDKYSQKWHNGTSSRTRSRMRTMQGTTLYKGLSTKGRRKNFRRSLLYTVRCILSTWRTIQSSRTRILLTKQWKLFVPCSKRTHGRIVVKFMTESTKRNKENSNIIKEIQASSDAAIRNQGASIKTLELQIGQMSKVLQERGFGSLPSSTKTNPKDQVKSFSTATTDLFERHRMETSPYADSPLPKAAT
ncbi:hypothetical protein Tco_0363355 [Tanacetum coccineum]